MHQTVPDTRVIKARYLTDEYRVVSGGAAQAISGIERYGDTVAVHLADETVLDYGAEEGVTVTKQTEVTLRGRFAAELHRIADDIVRLELPVGSYPSLRLGVLDSRTDLKRWAEYLGTAIDASDGTGIPSVTASITLGGDDRYGPGLTVAAQSPKEQSEADVLRARVAELEAQIAGGTR